MPITCISTDKGAFQIKVHMLLPMAGVYYGFRILQKLVIYNHFHVQKCPKKSHLQHDQ